jgi:tRNA nucleotidyltransferase (CCA-adding enzyme)
MRRKSLDSLDPARLRRDVPRGALEITDRLHRAGGAAYLVGGCLRDLVLGREPKDWDIATDLAPDDVKKLFRRVHEVGAAFGTLMVPWHDGVYEVTTFRTEGPYSDGRHPDEVAFTTEVERDLERRDFTINALAWDPRADHIVDPFGGLYDLERRSIRAVGDPALRFREDALRLMRAIRFSAQLDFRIERATWHALRDEAEGLRRISQERIREELNRILLAPTPSRGLLLMIDAGLLAIVLPELEACRNVRQNRFHSHDVLVHSLMATDAAPEDNLIVRLAALFHDVAKPQTREERDGDYTFYAHQVMGARIAGRIMRRLAYSNEERERVEHLVYHHMFYYEPEWTDSAVRRFVRAVGVENIPDLIALRMADMGGNTRKSGDTSPLEALLARIDEVIAKDTALNVKDLAIGGRELMALGLPEGPAIGRILRALLERVLDDPAFNERETLLAEAQRMVAAGEHLNDRGSAACPPVG